MKHFETQGFIIKFCLDHFMQDGVFKSHNQLYDEQELFLKAWPSANVSIDYDHFHKVGFVRISYSNRSQCYNLAHDASMQFRNAVKRHNWWKEIQE